VEVKYPVKYLKRVNCENEGEVDGGSEQSALREKCRFLS
jgi:hypothetical protein